MYNIRISRAKYSIVTDGKIFVALVPVYIYRLRQCNDHECIKMHSFIVFNGIQN